VVMHWWAWQEEIRNHLARSSRFASGAPLPLRST